MILRDSFAWNLLESAGARSASAGASKRFPQASAAARSDSPKPQPAAAVSTHPAQSSHTSCAIPAGSPLPDASAVADAGFRCLGGLGDDRDAAGVAVVAEREVAVGIEADGAAGRNVRVLVHDGAMQPGAAADDRVVEDDAVVHFGVLLDHNVIAEHGIPDPAAGDDAAAGDQRLDRDAAALFFVEHEFGRRLVEIGAHDRPGPVE